MFDTKKYVTRGIADQMPLELQLYLWNMIEEARNTTNLDYLQVFELKAINQGGQYLQQITHTQEVPPYNKTVVIKIDNPINNCKVFCIDDTTHSTLLFANEY